MAFYEKMLLMPTDCITVIVSYKPYWRISAVMPPSEHSITVIQNVGPTVKVDIKTPMLLWHHTAPLSRAPEEGKSTMYLFAVRSHPEHGLETCPYLISNVHENLGARGKHTGQVCWGEFEQPLNLRGAHSSFFTSPFTEDLHPVVYEADMASEFYTSNLLDRDPDDQDEEERKIRERYSMKYANFVRDYTPGNQQAGNNDMFSNNLISNIYGNAHVSFKQHVDAVLISTRPETLELFPTSAHRRDRKGRACIIGAAKRISSGWLVNVEGNLVKIPFSLKPIKATRSS